MADPHVLHALRRKYGETLGRVAAGAGDASDLDHLAAVLRLFGFDDVSAIKPIRPRISRGAARNGVWVRAAIDVLRNANAPMSAGEIARRIAAARGIADPKAVQSIECSLLGVFRRGAFVSASGARPRRWFLRFRDYRC